jgi:dihydropteroate synthase
VSTLLPPLDVAGRRLSIERGRPLVMGIVNANPDSFSDRVRLDTTARQFDHAMALVADGADLIDVGGESGVTYTGVSAAEVEAGRVVPLIERLAAEGVLVSVDTWKPAVARAAIAAGAGILNDVSGLADPGLADVCAQTGAALVVMHTRAAPKQEHFADYGGRVVEDVEAFLRERLALAIGRGVPEERLIVDPGPDFAKTPAESAEVLRALGVLHALGRPILLPVSRKYLIGAITGRAPDERLAGTLAALAHGVAAGAAIVRVHDVAAAVDHLRVWRVLEGLDPVPDPDPGDDALKWIRASAPPAG